MKRSAFTLIELLVVVTVIAVLVALLLPVFASARHASKASVCASNLRQLATATLLYTQDHAEAFPLGFYPTHAQGNRCLRTLWGTLSPYLKAYQVTTCPANPQPTNLTAIRNVVGIPLCADEPAQVSLMPNWCLMVNCFTYPEVESVTLAQIPFPADTGFWFDGNLLSTDGSRFEPGSLVEPVHGHRAQVPDLVQAGETQRYHGRVQAVFVDGHIKSYPTRLLHDVERRGDFVNLIARPTTIDGRLAPRWAIQGHRVYRGMSSFVGWPSRASESDPNRMLLRCYPRPYYCDEWLP